MPEPFESRIVIREDGTVVIEHAGEGLEELPGFLDPEPQAPEGQSEPTPGPPPASSG